MPELPDVEIFRQYLQSTSLHQIITGVEVESAGILKGISASELSRALKGKRFQSARRHGKYLLVELDQGPWLALHFGMTGHLKYFKDLDKDPEYDRLLLSFENGFHLAYVSRRKLGKVELADDLESFVQKKQLGPDALSLDLEQFRKALQGKRAAVKAFLMNQHYLAGVGNVYADEILFQCGLHPETAVDDLVEDQIKGLVQALGKVLRRAVDRRADPKRFPDAFLLPHRHDGGRCPRSHGKLEKMRVSGRATYYCPECQKKIP